MKQWLCMVYVMLGVVSTKAQTVTYATLQLTTNKTTTLVFPAAIKPADLGSKDILAQKALDNENILFLKAARENFPETNLTVITSDGKLYTFTVVYDSVPFKTMYNIRDSEAMNRDPVLFKQGQANPATVERCSKRLLHAKRMVHGITDGNGDMRAVVSGIYVKDDLMFFQLSLENSSTINYDIEFIRFSINDNRIAKRTAAQQQELTPVCTAGNTKRVKANTNAVAVFAFDKFTIPYAKSFIIEIGEKNGGRHLKLKVRNNKIIRAAPLNSNRDLY